MKKEAVVLGVFGLSLLVGGGPTCAGGEVQDASVLSSGAIPEFDVRIASGAAPTTDSTTGPVDAIPEFDEMIAGSAAPTCDGAC